MSGVTAYLSGFYQAAAAPPSNWWTISGATVVAAYQPKAAASLAASYSNLVSPGTNDAAPGSAPTWNSTDGWIFNGTPYLVTGIVPSSGSWSMFIRYSGASGTTFMAGTDDTFGNNKMYVSPLFAGNRLYANGNNAFGSAGSASGVIGVAGTKGYINGSDDGVTLGSYSNTQTNDIYLGALHGGVGPTGNFSGNIQAVAIYSTTLSSGDASTLTTAMNAL